MENPIDSDGPIPDQFTARGSIRLERLNFILHVLNRLGFTQRDSPQVIKTSPLFPTPYTSSWGSIDLAQLEACIKEELSK